MNEWESSANWRGRVYPVAKPKPISSAPRDGTRVRVYLDGEGAWVEAYWAQQTQAWVRWDDPERRTLRQVTRWLPSVDRRK